jgi:2-(1,2-epoxy-1,2-dihydrophenyl)acetyl-CoA isomerase
MVKKLLATSFQESLETQMELEARGIAEMAGTADGREGIDAFLSKRAPGFRGA